MLAFIESIYDEIYRAEIRILQHALEHIGKRNERIAVEKGRADIIILGL
jgi:hypothetical protein